MKNIKNIIFDLGGIFLNIDFARTRQAFIGLGVADFDNYYTQHHASNLFELLETGKITPEEFHNTFVKETGVHLSYDQLREAWNALLMDFPVERIDWLKSIRSRYKTFLFSNTNQLHYDAFSTTYRQQFGEDFDSNFIKAYYSHQLGLRKPYIESYQFILNEQNLKPEETLFIDDTLKNIEGARKAGLHTHHLVYPETLLDLKW
jgi:putative hydrolase of the HAD superfamily